MKYRYRSEEEMKDSGVEWLGKIPKAWDVKKLKYLAKIDTGDKDTQDKEENGIYPFFVRSDNVERSNNYSFEGEAILTAGDGVGVAKVFHYINGRFAYHQRVYKISNFKEVSGKFLYYYIKDNLGKEVEKISAKTTVDSLRLPMFLKFPVLITRDSEKKILEFLDKKTAQFDTIISKKEALIQRLEEAKKSLISEVVTGKVKVVKTSDGYEIRKRKKEEMKDSRVEWLENVPNKWKVVKLKHLVSTKITDGPHETPILVDEGIPFLSAEAIVNSKVSITNMRGYITEEQYDIYAKKSTVYIGDILFCKSGSTTGKSALVETNEKFGIWSPLAIIRANFEKIHFKNLFYIIQSSYFRVQVENYWTFGTQPNIGMGTLENLYIPFNEDKKEQKYICEYLDNKIEAVDELINKVSSQINYLKEAKQSLISEAVTGKIEILD